MKSYQFTQLSNHYIQLPLHVVFSYRFGWTGMNALRNLLQEERARDRTAGTSIMVTVGM